MLFSEELLISSLPPHLPSSLLKTGLAHHKDKLCNLGVHTFKTLKCSCGVVDDHSQQGKFLSLFGENEGGSEHYYLAKA